MRLRIAELLCRGLIGGAAAAFAQAAPPPLAPPPPPPPSAAPSSPTDQPATVPGLLTALAFDAESKEYTAQRGEQTVQFIFNVTNVSPADVAVIAVRTSCGCTVAELPSTPWILAPGASGPIKVTADLLGRRGILIKSVNIDSTAGFKSLLIRVNLPDTAAPQLSTNQAGQDRILNMQIALGDRQAVFRGDCARCHLEPARSKMGASFYASACAVCHEATNRASMVSDLRLPKKPRDVAYWRDWISRGKPGTLMPAWALSEGGPLTDQQINSLVDYLYRSFPRQPPRLTVPAPSTVATQTAVRPWQGGRPNAQRPNPTPRP